jgi:diguanylate cyclase (GGDEF)-like protein
MTAGDDDVRVGRVRLDRPRPIFVRFSAFVAVAIAAQASAALPPGPHDPAFYWASTGVLALVAASMFLPWARLPRWAVLVTTLAYLSSVCLLLISGGTNPSVPSTAGGLSALVLLPVVGIALSYPRAYSVVVVVAAMVTLTAAGIVAQSSEATNVRRLLLWTAVSVVITTAIYGLRGRLEGKVRDSDELARLGRLMNAATQSLTSRRDPKEVMVEGTKIMAELAGGECSRSVYLRVRDDVVMHEAVTDEMRWKPTSHLLRDNPYVRQVWETKRPLLAEIDRTSIGPTLRSVVVEANLSHAVWIPIAPEGELHGIISVASRGAPISEDAFARCRALGHVVELALGNALAHHELEIQANTDVLTGLANRRGLDLYLQSDRQGGATAILVMDVDGLKAVNDTHGHAACDRMLVGVARAASAVLRGGDLLARTGGDEFVAVVNDADDLDAHRVAERITAAVGKVTVQGVHADVSIGFASCTDGKLDRTRQLADEAMYRAKAGRPLRTQRDRPRLGLLQRT